MQLVHLTFKLIEVKKIWLISPVKWKCCCSYW